VPDENYFMLMYGYGAIVD